MKSLQEFLTENYVEIDNMQLGKKYTLVGYKNNMSKYTLRGVTFRKDFGENGKSLMKGSGASAKRWVLNSMNQLYTDGGPKTRMVMVDVEVYEA